MGCSLVLGDRELGDGLQDNGCVCEATMSIQRPSLSFG